jgi:hypothetical protein
MMQRTVWRVPAADTAEYENVPAHDMARGRESGQANGMV